MKKFLSWSVIALLILFIGIRFPGIDLPYHQDEYKSVVAAEQGLEEAGEFFLHPPLLALLLRLDAVVFGADGMRLLPLLFGAVSAALLYAVVRRRAGEMAGRWSLALYAVSFYSVWASLMVDVDGAVLPTLFLAAVYAYDRVRDTQKKLWVGILIGVCLIGLLTKLSFVLVIGALMLDVLWTKRSSLTKQDLIRGLVALCGCVVIGVLAFFAVHLISPNFRIDGMIAHALYYVGLEGRGWTQILVQAMKAVYYLSPLLLIPLIFVRKEWFGSLRLFSLYLGVGVLFYFVLFDFSKGALDKYLMFSIVPLAAFAGTVLSTAFAQVSRWEIVMGGVVGGVCSLILMATLFFSPEVLPLYPKTAWFSAILHGNLNILTPFTGGSGPAGFYVSFLFIFAAFLMSAVLGVIALIRPKVRAVCLSALVVVGIFYNAVFIEELMFGQLYGNAPVALTETLAFVASSPEISSVITYNDLGAYELTEMGKYAGRFYAAPQFEESHVERFTTHVTDGGGYFMVVGIPPLYEGFYTTFFSTCDTLFATTNGSVTSTVYLCTPANE